MLILRRNIDSEDTAKQIEMAFIQTLNYLVKKEVMPPLTNVQKNSNKQGDANFVSYENRIDIIAEPFDPAKIGDQKLEKVWFFNIKKDMRNSRKQKPNTSRNVYIMRRASTGELGKRRHQKINHHMPLG